MASKFSEFLEAKKIDPRRILVASRQIERLRSDDRSIKLAQRRKKGDDAPKKEVKEGDPPPPRPRSGRPVTTKLLREATEGKSVPAAAKTRILRAVNRVLEQKKQETVDLRVLF
jgi:hypothetical protein